MRKYLILERECDLFYGENHCKMHALGPEICLFENTCSVQGSHTLNSDKLVSHLIMAFPNSSLLTNLLP